MSGLILQRVVARMLFDPRWRAEVFADPEGCLATLSLSDRERGWLLEPDPRRWGADTERRQRCLEAMLRESLVSSEAALAAGLSRSQLIEFFSSQGAHQSIQSGTRLLYSYLGWLEARLPPPLSWLPSLEAALARGRASTPAPPLPPAPLPRSGRSLDALKLGLPAGAVILILPLGAFAEFGRRLSVLQAAPEPVLEALKGAPWTPEVQAKDEEALLLIPRVTGLHCEQLSPGLAGLLELTAQRPDGRPLRALLRHLRAASLKLSEARSLIQELLDDQILVRVSPQQSRGRQRRAR